MEIVPGRGVGLVTIGDHRSQAQERVGPLYYGPGGSRAVVSVAPYTCFSGE
ncbi:hypothetical protein [Streptomyces sp. NPDC002785]|uniref:hypothetical protein n=1 Tax=Streptomyces sp. NPDC002785 TaxID=3154543 RepID=UPI00331FF643